MTDDTISRKVAIDALFELYEYQRDIDPTEAADLVRQGIFLAEKKIEKLPSAQPERKTGKWIVYYECPKCGEITKDFMEYCPFCGADMREGDNE